MIYNFFIPPCGGCLWDTHNITIYIYKDNITLKQRLCIFIKDILDVLSALTVDQISIPHKISALIIFYYYYFLFHLAHYIFPWELKPLKKTSCYNFYNLIKVNSMNRCCQLFTPTVVGDHIFIALHWVNVFFLFRLWRF